MLNFSKIKLLIDKSKSDSKKLRIEALIDDMNTKHKSTGVRLLKDPFLLFK